MAAIITSRNVSIRFLVLAAIGFITTMGTPPIITAHALSESTTTNSITALVTGSTDGIGVTTARTLLGKNNIDTVLIHGRNSERIQSSVADLQASARNGATVIGLPPSDLATVQGSYDLAQSVLDECGNKNLGILVNNAGVYSNQLVRNSDGLELTFAVNVLAPFVVTCRLLKKLLEHGSKNSTSQSRIVIASSVSQSWSLSNDYWDDVHYNQRPYSAHGAYSESKLLDAMLCVEMADRLQKAGIDASILTCNCLDPGTVNTKMLLDGWGPIGINVNSAKDEAWCATDNELNKVTGQYFVGRSRRRASSAAYDQFHRGKLWETLSELAPTAAREWDQAIAEYGSASK